MTVRVYNCLKELRKKFGPRECGKICQKLLAISFRMAGCDNILERGVQGVDVDACQPTGEKLTIEVKTTVGNRVPIQVKDIEGLRQRRRQDGYQPVLAVLRIHIFYEWWFASADSLQAGIVPIESLRPYRLSELESLVSPHFDEATCEHFDRTMAGSQAYLDNVLRQHGVRVGDRSVSSNASPSC
jgi:Holliday junction resolvase